MSYMSETTLAVYRKILPKIEQIEIDIWLFLAHLRVGVDVLHNKLRVLCSIYIIWRWNTKNNT